MSMRLPSLRSGRHRGELLLVASVLVALSVLWPRARAAELETRFAVATESADATRASMKQLEASGNAVDAAVTAAFVAGVASPTSSGIGGGGFAIVWLAREKRAVVLDFRETAPDGIDASAFENRPFPKNERGRLVGVPGEVKGLFELHRRYGRRKWAELVRPAAQLAETGYEVGEHLANMLAQTPELASLDAGLARLFFPHQKAAVSGTTIKNPKLAATLRRIAAEGPRALYAGVGARDLVDSVGSFAGALARSDLERYAPVEREPLRVDWEGYQVYTMPPPSAGGLMLAESLQMLRSNELKQLGFGTGAYQHLLAEVMRGAIADRMRYLGDPAKVNVNLKELLDPRRLQARRTHIDLKRTQPATSFSLHEHGTDHLVTSDAEGNFVSLTTTVNHLFGSKISARRSGIVLNDELDDFNSQKDVQKFGISESPNRARPGARPVSSMTPTLVVKDGAVVLAIGGSGGTTIATNVTQLVLARLVFGLSPERLVHEPRFYVPTQSARLELEEPEPSAVIEDLRRRGENTGIAAFKTSAVQMIAVEHGRKLAAADPRKHGVAQVR